MLDSQTIPTWLVAANLLITGLVWILAYRRRIRLEFKIFSITFILQGIFFAVIFQTLKNVDIDLWGFVSRLMIIILCLSQSLPLAVSYIRSFDRDDS
jgi:hypothetical protein